MLTLLLNTYYYYQINSYNLRLTNLSLKIALAKIQSINILQLKKVKKPLQKTFYIKKMLKKR